MNRQVKNHVTPFSAENSLRRSWPLQSSTRLRAHSAEKWPLRHDLCGENVSAEHISLQRGLRGALPSAEYGSLNCLNWSRLQMGLRRLSRSHPGV